MRKALAILFVFLALLVVATVFVVPSGEHKSARQICPGHQAQVWDAAVSYYLEHRMKRDDLIDPQQLSAFFAEGYVPRCPLGTNNYAPFKILEGPKCPQEPTLHVIRRIWDGN